MLKSKPKILIVDDDETTLFACERALSRSGHAVIAAKNLADAKTCVVDGDLDAVLLDLKLPDGNALDWLPELRTAYPDLPVIIVTGAGDVSTAVKAMQSGAENFLTKPVEIDNLEVCLQKALEIGSLRKHDRIHRRLDKKGDPFFGSSAAAKSLVQNLRLAAGSDTVVLVLGETGTGKGVLAKWIHDQSARRTGAFVELNCSCLRGDLLRSELFGHAKGSFTSAVADREGLVEVADQGTLFLDEIGDMDIDVQAQLLKTIEERTFRRVGENRLRKSDFRLICATNKDLLKETEKGTFRKDLYYRICVLPLSIPPLREQTEDIPGLVMHLLNDFGHPNASVSPEVLELLMHCQWPGNIRELRNILERALLLAHGGPLTADCFPGLEIAPGELAVQPLPQNLHEVELEYLKRTVDSCNGDKAKASKMLGISLATLYRKLGKTRQAIASPS